METNQWLVEIVSWRFVTELWRRWPKHFDLIEMHPGGGQYDCLALRTKGEHSETVIDVNRGGSVHTHIGEMRNYSDWLERMLGRTPTTFLDEIANGARLPIPKKRPPSTPATLTYRYISDFLTHSVGRLENWQCRNGFEDTSGYGGGVRRHFFEQFPLLRKEDTIGHGTPICGCHEFNFWFLLKDEKPVLCLDTSGRLFRRDGACHDLPSLYKHDRRIWPLICETALDILP